MEVFFTGEIRHIIFNAPDTGFTVAVVTVTNVISGEIQTKEVKVSGELPKVSVGEVLEIKGEWVETKYGQQIKIVSYNYSHPTTEHGIFNFLKSGLVEGIGPTLAAEIIDKFGTEALDILDNDITRLSEIEGIGVKRITTIKESWLKHKKIREVMIQLQAYDISTGFCMKIYDKYGVDSLNVIQRNPYRLAYDIEGIGFIKADKIGLRLGFPTDSPERIKAALLYTLNLKTSEEGHVCYPYSLLIVATMELLNVEEKLVYSAFTDLVKEEKIIYEKVEDRIGEQWYIYPIKLYRYEKQAAVFLKSIMDQTNSTFRIEDIRDEADVANEVYNIAEGYDIKLTQKQMDAVVNSLTGKVSIITGGPGTGKTTIIKIIIRYLNKNFGDVLISMAAPTGRAAKRMKEVTGHSASTIHRLLEFNPGVKRFIKDEDNQLLCRYLIIDESSMIDISLMYYLLKAVPEDTVIIFIGDMYQLPSIGPGNVLRDMIGSEIIPTVTLDVVFRQAKNSMISVNAHLINAGKMPHLIPFKNGNESPFYFIEEEDPEKIKDKIETLVSKYLPEKYGYDPMRDIQVLSPMNIDKILGTTVLNQELQQLLNKSQVEIKRGYLLFKEGDKVMQIKNNYDKNVFNGDIGYIDSIRDKKVYVNFDDGIVIYENFDLDELRLSYAVSIHKFQGSEYPVIVLPITKRHYRLLQRNLIYTGITRGKELVILVGSSYWLQIGINNNKIQKRHTFLKKRIISESA